MSDLRKALKQLAANLRHDAAMHGTDVRHPRVVLENRAADVERLLAAHPEPAPRPVVDREALLHHGDVLEALTEVYEKGSIVTDAIGYGNCSSHNQAGRRPR